MDDDDGVCERLRAHECTDDITIGFLLVIVRFIWTTLLMQNTETQKHANLPKGLSGAGFQNPQNTRCR